MILALTLAVCANLAPQETIQIRQVLAIDALGTRLRSAVFTDALEAAHASGTLATPHDGSALVDAAGVEHTWKVLEATAEGKFTGDEWRNGWAFAQIAVPTRGPFALSSSGNGYTLVDGFPRAGDVYQLGTSRLPMFLEAGVHDFYFRLSRLPFSAKLEPLSVPTYFEPLDTTLPDVLQGEGGRLWIGQLVSNASDQECQGWSVLATPLLPSNVVAPEPLLTKLRSMKPGTQTKLALPIPVPLRVEGTTYQVQLALRDERENTVHQTTLNLRVREPAQTHRRTFLSSIDDSVQYFAVTPPPAPLRGGELPALILSLHGASVEAQTQSEAYQAKDWAYVIAPTNRRPYGFDWEDWGRKDALEVLALAEQLYGTDPNRTYLTGHSMGGHGTWQIGAHHSNRFAAIAPSAGWNDFWSYGGGGEFPADDPIGQLLSRSVHSSRTQWLRSNFAHVGVYVLHGDADETVPVAEARSMRAMLGNLHPNFAYYEEPGAQHWWGDRCVDWPPLIEFLKGNKRKDWEHALDLEFTTVSPAIRSQHGWLRIERAIRALEPARLRATLDPKLHTLQLEGDNLDRIVIDLRGFLGTSGTSARPKLDQGRALQVRFGDHTWVLEPNEWNEPIALGRQGAQGFGKLEAVTPSNEKNPRRMGPFKEGFGNRMVFVYGTQGNPEENAWSFAKARYDLETWRYRGNGSVALLRDVDFVPSEYPDRSVVLYGNQETNAAFGKLLSGSPYQLTRRAVQVGDHRVEGDNLGLLAIYPRSDSEVAYTVIVGGTGQTGARLMEQMPYFVSGVGYPDWTVFEGAFLQKGLPGILGAGFLNDQWSSDTGSEAHWR